MKLKVCGMKHNTREIASLEPDYLGFIFWEGSSRNVEGSTAQTGPDGPLRVGVFVDAAPEEILDACRESHLDMVQLHGQEEPEYCRLLAGLLEESLGASPEIIKAFALGDDFDFGILEAYLSVCDYFLFDSRGPLPGGNGKGFDWTLLADYPFRRPFFLSGGIGPDSVEALKAFAATDAARYCHAIDVNSRFERRPGEKDPQLLRTFMSADFWPANKHGDK